MSSSEGSVVLLVTLLIPGFFVPFTWLYVTCAFSWFRSQWLFCHGHFTVATIEDARRYVAKGGSAQETAIRTMVRLRYTTTASPYANSNEQEDVTRFKNPGWFDFPPTLWAEATSKTVRIVMHPRDPQAFQFVSVFKQARYDATLYGLIGFLVAVCSMVACFLFVLGLEVPYGQTTTAIAVLSLIFVAISLCAFLHVRMSFRQNPRDGYSKMMELQEESNELIPGSFGLQNECFGNVETRSAQPSDVSLGCP